MSLDNVRFSPEALAAYKEAYPEYGIGKMAGVGNTYSTNQFYGIAGMPGSPEPMGIARTNIDNPPFLYPKKQYMDSAGRTHAVQRGYMRSLLTDPAVDLSGNAKPRRVFFQFNPVALQRSVQQNIGAMNPLLQDPVQLTQPVPGTATFAFELFFNREHEVNAHYNYSDTDWLMLPNGQQALVSEIGVLADLMLLDSITGQGLSQDLIQTLTSYSQAQYNAQNKDINDAKQEAIDRGDKEAAKTYEPYEVPDQADIDKIFKNNLGNTAFLNPLPFRVMFSSLFMVEGVATSVDVIFQKFSRTMVPTQCKVTIQMYALYLGFAKKNTFIYDNLIQSAQLVEEQQVNDPVTQQALDIGLNYCEARLITKGEKIDKNNPFIQIRKLTINPLLLDLEKKRTLGNITYQFFIEYKITETVSTTITDENLKASRKILTEEDGKDTFEQGTQEIDIMLVGEDFVDSMYSGVGGEGGGGTYQNTPYEPYVTWRVGMTISAESSGGSALTSKDFIFTQFNNDQWFEPQSASPTSKVLGPSTYSRKITGRNGQPTGTTGPTPTPRIVP
jgi:hypothetical protein